MHKSQPLPFSMLNTFNYHQLIIQNGFFRIRPHRTDPFPSPNPICHCCNLSLQILELHYPFSFLQNPCIRFRSLAVVVHLRHFHEHVSCIRICPQSHKWIKLPIPILPLKESFTTSNGSFFTVSPEKFGFKRIFDPTWRQTAPPKFCTLEPLITVYNNDPNCSKLSRFILVGVNLEGCLAMEIYNPCSDFWEICPPPPHIFGPGNSPNLLCAVLFREKIYVFGIHSCFISPFDLRMRSWSNARTLRPPGVLFSYLISCQDQLVLAGLCRVNGEPEFNLWRIDERTLEFREIGVMPEELHSCFFGSEGELKFTSLKCVGSGNVVYLFGEERERNCPACVCEISSSGKCRWRRIPDLPESVTYFGKVTSFCSSVSLQDFLGKSKACLE